MKGEDAMLNWRKSWNLVILVVLLLGLLPLVAMAEPAAQPDWSKVDTALLDQLEAEGHAGFHVILKVQADVSGAKALATKTEKSAYVFDLVTQVAEATQPPLLDYLLSQDVAHKSRYIQNMIEVSAGLEVVEWMAARPDVARIVSLPDARLDPTFEGMEPEEIQAIEWNILRVKAPDVWAMGVNGEGAVVASNDTGVDYTHSAINAQYRGNLGGGSFDHNYNWWNGYGSSYPSDYDGHGTHTVGTMVGDDGGSNQIGVAPGAKWMACGGLYNSDVVECFEFFLAPWDLSGQNPDPTKSPDSVNNSWYDPSSYDYRPIIQTLNAAGIAVIKSAGNGGSGCSTITNPGYVPEIITTAAFDSNDNIAYFSSRGPTSNYGETILKPEVAAPGVSVRSSIPGNSYGYKSGTSMAAPHTTALVGLIWSAASCLEGDVPATKQIMMDTAEAKIDAQCPPFVDHPNDVWGWGVLDDLAAVQAAIDYCGGSGDTMNVELIKMRYRDFGGGRYIVYSTLRIVDQNDMPLEGATVDAEWTLPDGSTDTQQVVTNSRGLARFRVKTLQVGEFEMCVTDVALDGYTYDPSQNGETCDTLTVP
jgi:hypothetical protein